MDEMKAPTGELDLCVTVVTHSFSWLSSGPTPRGFDAGRRMRGTTWSPHVSSACTSRASVRGAGAFARLKRG